MKNITNDCAGTAASVNQDMMEMDKLETVGTRVRADAEMRQVTENKIAGEMYGEREMYVRMKEKLKENIK